MKRLIHVPMVHTQDAIGETWEGTNATLAKDVVTNVKDVSPKFWQVVQEKLGGMNVANARFYVEGYTGQPIDVEAGTSHVPIEDPDAPTEDKIIFEFIKRNGGRLETTEDRSLLDQAVGIVKPLARFFSANPDEFTSDDLKSFTDTFEGVNAQMEENKMQREEAIAGNINRTLQDGEIGFLFLGETHDAFKSLLAPDIQVELLDERLVEVITELHREIENIGDTKPEGNEPHGKNGPEGNL